MKRLFLSAAVKKMFVRLVSTLTTSSESCGTSSRFRGVGDGDGDATAFAASCLLPWFFADIVRFAIPAQRNTKTESNKITGRLISRYCIFTSKTPYCATL